MDDARSATTSASTTSRPRAAAARVIGSGSQPKAFVCATPHAARTPGATFAPMQPPAVDSRLVRVRETSSPPVRPARVRSVTLALLSPAHGSGTSRLWTWR